jgi:hypothetical protein
MFEMILAEPKAGETPLKPETRQAVIRAGLHQLHHGLRQLPHVLPEMSALQIASMKLTLSEAVTALYGVEAHLETVTRLTAGVVEHPFLAREREAAGVSLADIPVCTCSTSPHLRSCAASFESLRRAEARPSA